MIIQVSDEKYLPAWAALRAKLWPETLIEDHLRDLVAARLGPQDRSAAFLALADRDEVIGFAEAALRHDYVNGCDSSPVAFLEGIYVEPDRRRTGVAEALCAAIEAWAIASGCSELASDTDLQNTLGQAFHTGIGFEETERVVFYRRRI